MSIDEIPLEPVAPPPSANGAADEEWQRSDKNGKEYIARQGGRPGIIWRQGDETIAEARTRDEAGREQRPRRNKAKTVKKPEAPRKLELKDLEESLAMALKAPGALTMTLVNDDWPTDHFNMAGPVLARHLVLASEHNPWLRRRLEEAATGGDAMWAMVSLVGVGGALIGYIVPPMIYFLNLPVSPKARDRWGIPPKQPEPPYAASAAFPPGPEGPPQPEPV